MYIKKIEINSFGCISDKSFSFDKGFNLIYGDNESGKTTLFSFVLFIFYGTKIKKQHGNITFKEKYMPWNGKPMQGSIEFKYKSHVYVISRLCSDNRNTISLLNINTGEQIKDRQILNSPGEYFWGVSADAFTKSVFFTASGASIFSSSNQELADLLSNSFENVSSEVSYNKISDILNEEILNISSSKRKNAIIPKLELQISELRKKQNESDKCKVSEDVIRDDITRLEREIAISESELESITSEQNFEIDISGNSDKRARNLLVLSLLLLIIALAVALLFRNAYTAGVFLLSAVLFIVSAICFAVSKNREERNDLRKVFTLQQNNDKIILLTKKIIELKTSKMKSEEILKNNSARFIEDVRINDELEILQNELAYIKEKLSALETAKKALDNAYREFKTVFSPELSRLTAKFFSRITNGKYQTVSVDDSFGINIEGTYGYKSVAALSHGCTEQAYLAMRLAFSTITLAENNVPFFLDDAFSFYDDRRLENTINFLVELSNDKQIIFSTCRGSECSIISKHNIKMLYI